MTARIFDNRLEQEWIGFTVLRRVIIAAAIVHFSLAAISGYRAVVQVYSVGIESPAVISAGAPIHARVTTSGRIMIDARIELVQGQKIERLAATLIRSNDSFFYDPRPKRATLDAIVPPDALSKFQQGHAAVRIIAEGRMQWLYIPPPKTQTVAVELR
jgi:hypothetical protein